MVELSTPVKSWKFLRKQNCNRRVAGSIPVRFIFVFFIFWPLSSSEASLGNSGVSIT